MNWETCDHEYADTEVGTYCLRCHAQMEPDFESDGLCPHGREGYCHDDATPAQRAAFDEAHAFAYAWAVGVHIERDIAEDYAGWYAKRVYTLDIEDWGTMTREFEEYEIEMGRRPARPVYRPTPRARRRRAA